MITVMNIYILVKVSINVFGEVATATARQADRNDKQWNISKISNTQVDNVNDLDVIIPMHDLIEYSSNYSKTSESL